MHASLAFVNGAGIADRDGLRLLNTLLSSSAAEATRPAKDHDKNQNQGNPKPGRFKNDPPDPKNPNEVRERHLKKIKR
jgi:hypothetical protein